MHLIPRLLGLILWYFTIVTNVYFGDDFLCFKSKFAEFALVFVKCIFLNLFKSFDVLWKIHCLLDEEHPLVLIDLMVVVELGKDSLALTNYGEDHRGLLVTLIFGLFLLNIGGIHVCDQWRDLSLES